MRALVGRTRPGHGDGAAECRIQCGVVTDSGMGRIVGDCGIAWLPSHPSDWQLVMLDCGWNAGAAGILYSNPGTRAGRARGCSFCRS
jgi:hypothetical protein